MVYTFSSITTLHTYIIFLKMKNALLHLFTLICFVHSIDAQNITYSTFDASSFENRPFPVAIYLPEDYDESEEPYPYYVFLHGCCGLNHQSHIEDFKTELNQLILRGEIAPMLMFFPSAQGIDFGNRHMWFNSERNGDFSNLITTDLLNWIADNFNVAESKGAIGGFSMGADGALRIALQEPNKFVAAVSHSSFPALSFFPNLIPALKNEAVETIPPYTFKPSNGLLSEQVFGAASAWSPNLSNPNYQLDFPLDSNGNLIDEVFQTWKNNADVNTIIRANWGHNKKVPIQLYIDAGINESFYAPNLLLKTELEELVRDENFEISYKFLGFNSGHVLNQDKIDSSLVWLNSIFESNVTLTSDHRKNDSNFEFSVAPNPSKSSITITLKKPKIADSYLLLLYNIHGEMLKKLPINLNTEQAFDIDLTSLAPGPYIISIIDRKTRFLITRQVIKG